MKSKPIFNGLMLVLATAGIFFKTMHWAGASIMLILAFAGPLPNNALALAFVQARGARNADYGLRIGVYFFLMGTLYFFLLGLASMNPVPIFAPA